MASGISKQIVVFYNCHMIKLSLHLIDYIIIISFLVVTLYVGFRFARKQKTLKSFFLAQGRETTSAANSTQFSI